jgi:DNA-binding NtrC family response regulator
MSESSQRNIRVLLVDDEEDLVTLLAARLNKRDMDVAYATSGREALDLDETHTFDVAILDLKMPHMDGVEVMSELKTRHPMIETIMITGHGTLDSALEAGKLEAFKYLLKPCDFDELVETIKAAFEHRRANLRRKYEEELIEGMDHFQSAQDILHHSDELRKKYEQD